MSVWLGLGAGILGELRHRIPNPRTGLIGGCGLPKRMLGTDLEPSVSRLPAATALNHQAISLAPAILN